MAIFCDSFVFDALFVVFVLFSTLYVYCTRNFNFWMKNGIPFVKPHPFVGSLKDVVLQKVGIGRYITELYHEHKNKPYLGLFAFDRPVLVVFDLDLIKKILVKYSQVFINRNLTVDEVKDPLSYKNIFGLKGQKWRHMRTNLTPTFTSGKMKKMFYLVDKCAKELEHYLDEQTAEGSLMHVNDTMARFTTDVIASCAFGIDSNSLKNPDVEFRRYLRDLFKMRGLKFIGAILAVFAPELMKIFRIQVVDSNVANFVRNLVWNTVEYREKHGIVRKDFLDNLMELRREGSQVDDLSQGNTPTARITEPKFRIDGDDFVAQCFAFLTAGFETSSTTMTYLLYEVALHPNIQQRLRNEITHMLDKHNNEVTYDGIQELTYLDMVISETLRKYPVVPFLDRVPVSDFAIPVPSGKDSQFLTLRKGTPVYIPVMGIHHDPQYYPEPERFDPERFTEENKNGRPPFTYLPFGEGPRNCIGMRFGLMQVKTGVSHILSRYEVTPCKDTQVPLVFDDNSVLLHTKTEVLLSFKKMSK